MDDDRMEEEATEATGAAGERIFSSCGFKPSSYDFEVRERACNFAPIIKWIVS